MTITMNDMAEAARKLLEAEEASAKAEEELKAKKESERKLREETIPGMFAELGVEKLTLTDGSVFSCTQEVYAAIPAPRRSEAYNWLEDHGFGGIIKTEVVVPFGKGEIELAKKLVDDLTTELGVTNAAIERNMYAQTLKAWLKEQLSAEAEAIDMEADDAPPGEDTFDGLPPIASAKVDLELFGARPVMTAKVKAPSKGRAKAVPGRGQVHEWNGD